MQNIDPIRLKRLREAKELSRAALAKVSNVSAKTIQRLEKHDGKSPRRETLDRLSKALKVKAEVLTGQEPLPESDPPFAPRSIPVTRRLFSEALLAYDLVEKRYGVPATAIMNAAPLFFVLLAEGSLAWRRKELAEIQEAIENVLDMGNSNRKLFARHAFLASEDSNYEEEAINGRNLFNTPFPDFYDFGIDDQKTNNPFTEYLHQLAVDLDIPGIEVDEGFVSSSVLDGMPAYSVCKDKLEKIAPVSSKAFIALQTADARISDIPEHLRSDSATEQRQEWLEKKISRKTNQWLEELDKLRKELAVSLFDF